MSHQNKTNKAKLDVNEFLNVLPTCKSHYCRKEKNIDMLDHKFMVPDHSRMECDSDHVVVEKAKKYSMQISDPRDWAQLIRMAGKKKPFNVIELTQEDFCDYVSLLRTGIQMSKSNEDGKKFVWQQFRWLCYVLDKLAKMLCKTSLKEEATFSAMDMTRQQPHPCLNPNKC
ncbi:hypothetical protein PR048_014234 [Dryococelus australis]|uniref:Uncharacterized protein n=1 Tax=Dryococelus australis TaxID=614101 RepID=A0ABQ9HE18_9NEOP|nr:hypothetical protein PR048_014234 [Dryococelus australis]